MTDRRRRQPVRCATRGCPHVGYWPQGLCPPHHREVAANLAAAARRARETPPPMTPLDVARNMLAANPRKETT